MDFLIPLWPNQYKLKTATPKNEEHVMDFSRKLTAVMIFAVFVFVSAIVAGLI